MTLTWDELKLLIHLVSSDFLLSLIYLVGVIGILLFAMGVTLSFLLWLAEGWFILRRQIDIGLEMARRIKEKQHG